MSISFSINPIIADALATLEARFAERVVQTSAGAVSYRECGEGDVPVVLLHGIGSASASWLYCALALEKDVRVIAWNAPGYGRSAPLSVAAPKASDYAVSLDAMLTALNVERCVLVGHSLGALMASAFVAAYPERVARLVLLSPALGYGAKPEKSAEVLQQRLSNLQTKGVTGMAEAGPARMLSPQASEEQKAWVRWNMSLLDPAGYTQATHMLCGDDIHRYKQTKLAGKVYCGSADIVTTPEASKAFAEEFGYPYAAIDGAGHSCYVEKAEAVAAILRQSI
jgi:pimeloyl-ACP methyl ester carboxylesterase